MKKLFLIIMAAILFLAIGCAAKASTSPLEAGRSNAALEEGLKTADPARPEEPAAAGQPRHITDEVQHASLPLTLKVDADVDGQGVAMPVAKVRPYHFTQADVDRAYDVLISDGYFADVDTQAVDGPELRSLIEGCIPLVERDLEEIKKEVEQHPEILEDDPDIIEHWTRNIQDYKDMLQEAQPLEAFPEASATLGADNDIYGGDTPMVMGFTEHDGKPYRLWVKNDPSNEETFLQYERFPLGWYDGGSGSRQEDAHSVAGVDYDKALRMAQGAADAVSGGQMAVAQAKGVVFDGFSGYNHIRFAFTRKVEGAQVTYDPRYIESDMYNDIYYLENADYSNYIVPWTYERFYVAVDNTGVQSLTWTYPCEVVETVSANVELLPSDQVMDVFSNTFFVKNSLLEDELNWRHEDERGNVLSSIARIDVTITDIRLGLMRVESGGDYLMLPVWDFFGYKEAWTPEGEDHYLFDSTPGQRGQDKLEEQEYSMLTINAMNGSIVDRDVGY